MRKFLFVSLVVMTFVFGLQAQTVTFSDANTDYTFEVPDKIWKVSAKPSLTSPNVEYVYGDRLEGHLEIRKINTEANEALSDVILRDQEQKLQFIPGFVAGKEESFTGNLKGKILNYEFTKAGKNMSGRFYYLRYDSTTVYVLRFTGFRSNLLQIRNQIDGIARSFKIKAEEKK